MGKDERKRQQKWQKRSKDISQGSRTCQAKAADAIGLAEMMKLPVRGEITSACLCDDSHREMKRGWSRFSARRLRTMGRLGIRELLGSDCWCWV